jgi:FixJ family two-component response regulator
MSKVLVVDDEANVAKSIRRLLEANGFEVITAEDGKNALDIMRRETDVAVIVSDQRMPKMTGSELFAQLSVEHPDIKRILLTGYTDLDSIRDAVNQGNIFRFLLKPWDDDELLKCVEEGEHYYLVKQENERLNRELEQANLNLEHKVAQKTRVLDMNIHSLKRYEKIVENLPVGLLAISDDGMVVLANKHFCSLFGFQAAVEGMPYRKVIPKEVHDLVDNFESGKRLDFAQEERTLQALSSTLEIDNAMFGKLILFQVTQEG